MFWFWFLGEALMNTGIFEGRFEFVTIFGLLVILAILFDVIFVNHEGIDLILRDIEMER